MAAFEPDGYVSELASGAYTHRGTDQLRAFYEQFFSDGSGIPLELCGATDDGRACALEYNTVSRDQTQTPPRAGIAVYVRGASGRLAAARIYDPRPAAELAHPARRRTSNDQSIEGPR